MKNRRVCFKSQSWRPGPRYAPRGLSPPSCPCFRKYIFANGVPHLRGSPGFILPLFLSLSFLQRERSDLSSWLCTPRRVKPIRPSPPLRSPSVRRRNLLNKPAFSRKKDNMDNICWSLVFEFFRLKTSSNEMYDFSKHFSVEHGNLDFQQRMKLHREI